VPKPPIFDIHEHPLLHPGLFRLVLDYSPRTGTLTWRATLSQLNDPSRWSTREITFLRQHVGKLAPLHGTDAGDMQRRFLEFDGIRYPLPKLVYYMHCLYGTGRWPERIEFRNGNPRDLRRSNLRAPAYYVMNTRCHEHTPTTQPGERVLREAPTHKQR